jgi:hypothetical protein
MASKSRSWLREPVVHFVALGALLFGLHAVVAGPSEAEDPAGEPVVVSDAFLEGLRERHRQRSGAEARDADLVREYARDEVLYREAVRLGLDRGDPIVRRRLVRKMELFLRTTATVDEPTEAELAAYHQAHPGAYREPERASFELVHLSRDRRGDRLAQDARALLETLDGEAPADAGDPFLLGRRFTLQSPAQIRARLGPELAEAVGEGTDGEWAGPVLTNLGAFLVRVTERRPGRVAPLAEIRERVEADWMRESEDEAFERAVAELVERHGVVRVAEGAR